MSSVTFTVPGHPLTWKRTDQHRGRRFKPAKMRDYQASIAAAAMYAMGRDRGSWPFEEGLFGLAIEAYHRGPPGDFDNYAKIVADALQGLLWKNDRQVKRGEQDVIHVGSPDEEMMRIRAWVLGPDDYRGADGD